MPPSPDLTLRAFLELETRASGTLKYHELQGFLFAVASAPELVMPSEWMPIVFGDQGAEYASLEEARQVTSALMAIYNSINVPAHEHRAALPADCRFREQPLANLEEDAPIAQWSRGFLRGHQWLEESWDAYVPKALDEEYASMLMTLSLRLEGTRGSVLRRGGQSGPWCDGHDNHQGVPRGDRRVRALGPFHSAGDLGGGGKRNAAIGGEEGRPQ